MDQAAVIITITAAATTTAKHVIHIFKLTTHANEQKQIVGLMKKGPNSHI